jgi:hypothetical protein
MSVTLPPHVKKNLMYAVRHHAKVLEPLLQELSTVLLFTDASWSWGTWKGGINSNFITVNGKQYFLAGRPALGCIEVKLSEYGSPVWRLKTRVDVLSWGRDVGLL